MTAHLLHLDPGGLLQRETADAGAEGDQREAPGAELVGYGEGAGGRAADDLGRGRASPSMVAAWITHRQGSSPAVVSTASPRPIGARSSLSAWTAGPPAR